MISANPETNIIKDYDTYSYEPYQQLFFCCQLKKIFLKTMTYAQNHIKFIVQ